MLFYQVDQLCVPGASRLTAIIMHFNLITVRYPIVAEENGHVQ
jgi:hypothetical protein